MTLQTPLQMAILGGMSDVDRAQVLALGQPRRCERGESLFRLGDAADQLYLVVHGRVDLTFPLSVGGTVREVAFESKADGSAVGWSALVSPYRFTLSAAATEPADLLAFRRDDLLRLFDAQPGIGYRFMRHVAEVVGRRLLQVQALWARELQRAMDGTAPRSTSPRAKS